MSVSRVWGIDLGHSAIKGVLLASAGDGVEILDAAIMTLPPVSGRRNELCRDSRVWKVLAEFEDRYRISKYPVALSIPPENTLIREIDITLVGKRSLEQLVYYEALNAIPYVLNDVVWDYHIFASESERKTGAHFKGLIFAAKKPSFNAYIQAFEKVVTDRIVDVILSPMGILSLMHFERPDKASCLGIDIGESSCSMVGLCEEMFWLRNIATGGRDVTEILAGQFEVGYKQAERAKRNIAASPMAKEMMGIVKPGINSLAKEMRTNLEYMERAGKKTYFDKVYIFGGSRRLPGLKGKIQRLSGQTPSSLTDFRKISISPRANCREVRGNIDRLAVALGAGIKALGKTPYQFSFAPRAAARGASLVGKKPIAVTGALIFWLVLGITFLAIIFAESTLQEAIVSAHAAGRKYVEQSHAFAESTDFEEIKGELDQLLALPVGRAQAVGIASGVGAVFADASRSDELQSRFKIQDVRIARRERAGEPGAGPEFDVYIQGRAQGEGLEESVAYNEMNLGIFDELSVRDSLCRMEGVARFSENGKTVTGDDADWDKLLRVGDRVFIENDGGFYEVEEIVSGSEFLLDRAFRGEDGERSFVVSRCSMEEWNHEKLAFRIGLSTPARGVVSYSIR